MISRQLLDEQGVFTCDMDELADGVAELLSTLQVLADRARDSDDVDLRLVLDSARRLAFGISRDLVEIDEVLRRRGAIIDAHERLRRHLDEEESPLDHELQ